MKKWITCIIAVVLLLTACGCQMAAPGNDAEAVGSASEMSEQGDTEAYSDADMEQNWIFEDEVLVGRVVPETGVLSSFAVGTPYVEELAIQKINELGGVIIDGKRCELRLMCKDSGSTVAGAEEAAKELIDEGIDIMIVANTADTVSPVSAVCEREDIVCISVDAPASAWMMGGPYTNSWHTFFDNEREMLCFLDAWERIDSNKKIGLMTANDSEGIEISTFIHDFAAKKGYTIVDAGAYYRTENDFSDQIEAFAREDCDIILGVMVSEDFIPFWEQLQATDYRPQMCTIAKACLFQEDVERLGELGDGLITEVWWTESCPFVSSIDGMTSGQLAECYMDIYGAELNQVPASVGYKYANVEILYDILKRAESLETDKLNVAAADTDLDTIVGHVAFNKEHVSLMSCLTGQWVLEPDGTYRREIVGNYLVPTVEVTADIKLLENE